MKRLKEILEIDKRIRFIAKITYNGEFSDYVYRKDLNLEMDEEKQRRMGVHAGILADSHRIIDNVSGKVHTTISLRPDIVSILFYAEPILYSVSIDKCEKYSELVSKLEEELLQDIGQV